MGQKKEEGLKVRFKISKLESVSINEINIGHILLATSETTAILDQYYMVNHVSGTSKSYMNIWYIIYMSVGRYLKPSLKNIYLSTTFQKNLGSPYLKSPLTFPILSFVCMYIQTCSSS